MAKSSTRTPVESERLPGRRDSGASTMSGRRPPPDIRVVPFPDNWRGDDSVGAHRATWGPDNNIPPLTAGEVVLIERGNLIATFTLHVVLRRGLGFYIRDCRLVRWGPDGQRVFLPQRSATIKLFAVSDDGEQLSPLATKNYYADLIFFDSNRGAKAFEQAALAAARHALAAYRAEQQERPVVPTEAGDDPPF